MSKKSALSIWANTQAQAQQQEIETAVMQAVAWCDSHHINPIAASKMSLREFGRMVRLNTMAPTPPPPNVMWGLTFYSDQDDERAPHD